jgi:hypothetical protein
MRVWNFGQAATFLEYWVTAIIAIQTRRQELADEHIEADRRLLLREEIRRHNVQLADAAKGAGVISISNARPEETDKRTR